MRPLLRNFCVVLTGIAGTTAISLGSPAHAQSFVCDPGVSGSGALGDLFASYGVGGSSCTVGDKRYSEFVLVSGTPRTATATINENPAALNHTISIGDLLTVGESPLSFSFKVDVVPGPGHEMASYTAQLGSTQIPLASNAGTISVVSALLGMGGAANGTLSGTTSVAGSSSPYGPGVFSDTFTLTVAATGGTIDPYSTTLNQRTPGAEVPAPLAILGAGTAFGFSRRLSRRVTQVS